MICLEQDDTQIREIACIPVQFYLIFSTASGALVVGGVRDICTMYVVSKPIPEIALSVQWSRTNQSVAVCGSLW